MYRTSLPWLGWRGRGGRCSLCLGSELPLLSPQPCPSEVLPALLFWNPLNFSIPPFLFSGRALPNSSSVPSLLGAASANPWSPILSQTIPLWSCRGSSPGGSDLRGSGNFCFWLPSWDEKQETIIMRTKIQFNNISANDHIDTSSMFFTLLKI